MGFFKSLRKVFKVAAPLALSFAAPGIGTAIGGALGATGTAAGVLGNSLLGAGLGALGGGGLKGALTGGATAGIGSYIGQAGGIGNALKNLGATSLGNSVNSLGSGVSNIFGSGAASIKPGVQLAKAGKSGIEWAAPGVQISNIGQKSFLSNLLPSTSGGGASSFGGSNMNLGDILGAYNTSKANEKMRKQLLAAQGKAEAAMEPYKQTGQAANTRLADLLGLSGNQGAEGYGTLGAKFGEQDYMQDPGYKFRLAEGEKALERSQAARGGLFSGAAMKAAQQYGQGLASEEYQNSYNRWRENQQNLYNMLSGQSSQGMGAAGALGDLYGTSGTVRAASTGNQATNINELLSSLFGSNVLKRDKDGRIMNYESYGVKY